MPMPITVLLVEDDVRQSDALRSLFEESSPDMAVLVAGTLKDALTHDRAGVDAVLLDLGLPDSSGLDTLNAIVARFAPVPVIVLTGTAESEMGVQVIALGAEDYLEKAIIPPAAVPRVVRYAIRRCERIAAAQRATEEVVHPEGEQLERILDAVPDRIFLFDYNLRVQYVNQAAARGLPFIEIGMHADDLVISTVHRVKWRSALQRALVSGVAERFDMDGTGARRYDVSLVPLRHGDLPSVVVVLRDIR
jgi:DNA-binding NarL/FixJ family response regulator